MEFFNSAIDVLKVLVMALGAGLAVWAWSICWKVTVPTTPRQMLMCHKVTHKN